MPTMRKVNGFTILAIIPEAATLAREFGDGEMGHTGHGYVIVADDGEQAVTAVMLNPQEDNSWIYGNYDFRNPEPTVRRARAMVDAMQRAGLDRLIGENFVIGNLAAVWGFDPNEVTDRG